MRQPKVEEKTALVEMVALDTPSLPSPSELLASFNVLSRITIDPNSVLEEDGTMVFALEGDHVAIGLMPAPIPWSELEGPCATAWWWPDANEAMKNHNSHIIVGLVGGPGNLIQRHISLTRLTAAVAMHTDTAGIYWGSGTLVHEPKTFIEQAKSLSSDDLPLPLWIDFRIERNEDESYRLFTTGMRAFAKLEIEIPRSPLEPAELFNFACSIANYVITKNPNIQSGHTIGRSATEKVVAVHAPSMRDAEKTVLRLEF